MSKFEKELKALELVYNNKERFDIRKTGDSQYIIFDNSINKEVFSFGNSETMIEILLNYAEMELKN